MPSTRPSREAAEAVVVTTAFDDTPTGGDEVEQAVSARDSALAALLVSPTAAAAPVMTMQAQVLVRRPPITGDTVSFLSETDTAGARYLVWSEQYPRMVGEIVNGKDERVRITARRGDVAIVPVDDVTASHVALGHLVPE